MSASVHIALNLSAVYCVGCGASLRARVEFGVAPVLAICNAVILLLLDWAECQGAITAIQ